MSSNPRQELAAVIAKAKAFTNAQRQLKPAALVLTAEPMRSSASAKEAALSKAFESAPKSIPVAAAVKARLVFVSATALPLESPAGKLLSKIIQAMGLPAQDVAVLPLDGLEAALTGLKPKALVALGGAALQGLLGPAADLGKLRGRFASHAGLPLMPTHHPSELMQNDTLKRHVWEDMKLVAAKLKILED